MTSTPLLNASTTTSYLRPYSKMMMIQRRKHQPYPISGRRTALPTPCALETSTLQNASSHNAIASRWLKSPPRMTGLKGKLLVKNRNSSQTHISLLVVRLQPSAMPISIDVQADHRSNTRGHRRGSCPHHPQRQSSQPSPSCDPEQAIPGLTAEVGRSGEELTA